MTRQISGDAGSANQATLTGGGSMEGVEVWQGNTILYHNVIYTSGSQPLPLGIPLDCHQDLLPTN